MKKLIFLIVILALAAANAFAARIYPAEGRVVDEQGQAVEYATVVLLKGSDQVAGMSTDDTCRFVLKVPSGDYTLSLIHNRRCRPSTLCRSRSSPYS